MSAHTVGRRFVSGSQLACLRRFGRPLSLLALLAPAFSLLAIASLPVRADTAAQKCDRFLARIRTSQPATGRTELIVRLDGALTPARQTQLAALGGDIYRHLPFLHSLALRVPTRNLDKLAALPFVRHLSLDTQVRKNDEFTVESSGADVAFQQYGLTGQGVAVAVVDSGVHLHMDLGSGAPGWTRVISRVNFVPNKRSPKDECGHGTHVAGIIGGNGLASTGRQYFHTFYGIAREANIVNLRVLDESGQGTVSNLLAAIQWLINNAAAYNIRVLNLSIGHPVGESYTTDPLCQAVEQAWQAGIVVVCAAGNGGRLQDTPDPSLDNEGYGTAYGSIQSPGNDPYVITVGAMKSIDGVRADDRIATYSGRGPSRLDFVLKPDIVAPGNRVISLDVPGGYLDQTYSLYNEIPWQAYRYTTLPGTSDKYFVLSGTSMATPVVSGAVALLLEADPTLTPDTIKARLMLSADKWTRTDGVGDPCTYGAGYLNIPAALNCTAVATQSALSPTLSEDDQGNVFINIDSALWGTNAIWGTGITDLNALWGLNAIWGTNTLASSNALWGTSVWTDNTVWGSSTDAADLSIYAIFGEENPHPF